MISVEKENLKTAMLCLRDVTVLLVKHENRILCRPVNEAAIKEWNKSVEEMIDGLARISNLCVVASKLLLRISTDEFTAEVKNESSST